MHHFSVVKTLLPSENLPIRKQVVLDTDIKQTLMGQSDLKLHIKGWLCEEHAMNGVIERPKQLK